MTTFGASLLLLLLLHVSFLPTIPRSIKAPKGVILRIVPKIQQPNFNILLNSSLTLDSPVDLVTYLFSYDLLTKNTRLRKNVKW